MLRLLVSSLIAWRDVTRKKNKISSHQESKKKPDEKKLSAAVAADRLKLLQEKEHKEISDKQIKTENAQNEMKKCAYSRLSVDDITDDYSACLIDSILMDMIENTNMDPYISEERRFMRYCIHGKTKTISTYILSSPYVLVMLSSSPLIYYSIQGRNGEIVSVAPILSYYWKVHISNSTCTSKDSTKWMLNIMAKTYMDTINCIYSYSNNIDIEDNIRVLLNKVINETRITNSASYLDMFINAYNKAVSVYGKLNIGKYNEFISIYNRVLKEFNMDMKSLFSVVISMLNTNYMTNDVVINQNTIFSMFGETMAIIFGVLIIS